MSVQGAGEDRAGSHHQVTEAWAPGKGLSEHDTEQGWRETGGSLGEVEGTWDPDGVAQVLTCCQAWARMRGAPSVR